MEFRKKISVGCIDKLWMELRKIVVMLTLRMLTVILIFVVNLKVLWLDDVQLIKLFSGIRMKTFCLNLYVPKFLNYLSSIFCDAWL